MATIVTTSIVTPQLTAVSTTEDIPVGTRVDCTDGGKAVYSQAVGELAQYGAVTLSADGTAAPLTTTTAIASKKVGFADTVSIASGSYGWIRTSGRPKVKLAANCDDAVTLFTTATAGVLDDATVSASQVLGVVSTVTISNATAVTCIVADGAMIAVFGASPGA